MPEEHRSYKSNEAIEQITLAVSEKILEDGKLIPLPDADREALRKSWTVRRNLTSEDFGG